MGRMAEASKDTRYDRIDPEKSTSVSPQCVFQVGGILEAIYLCVLVERGGVRYLEIVSIKDNYSFSPNFL